LGQIGLVASHGGLQRGQGCRQIRMRQQAFGAGLTPQQFRELM
jgi:hypothetical protein